MTYIYIKNKNLISNSFITYISCICLNGSITAAVQWLARLSNLLKWLSFPIPSLPRFRFKRAAELKHGRVAMLVACLRKIETEIALPQLAATQVNCPSILNDLRTLVHSKNVCPVKLVGLHDVLTPQKSRDPMQASVGLVTQHYVRLPGFDMAGTGSRFFWWSRCCVEATGRGTDNLVASGLTGPASSIPLSQSQPSTNSAPWH